MNQDKTSKQMASLRIEIQKLTMELMEFKQVHVIQLDPGNWLHVFSICFDLELTSLGLLLIFQSFAYSYFELVFFELPACVPF